MQGNKLRRSGPWTRCIWPLCHLWALPCIAIASRRARWTSAYLSVEAGLITNAWSKTQFYGFSTANAIRASVSTDIVWSRFGIQKEKEIHIRTHLLRDPRGQRAVVQFVSRWSSLILLRPRLQANKETWSWEINGPALPLRSSSLAKPYCVPTATLAPSCWKKVKSNGNKKDVLRASWKSRHLRLRGMQMRFLLAGEEEMANARSWAARKQARRGLDSQRGQRNAVIHGQKGMQEASLAERGCQGVARCIVQV